MSKKQQSILSFFSSNKRDIHKDASKKPSETTEVKEQQEDPKGSQTDSQSKDNLNIKSEITTSSDSTTSKAKTLPFKGLAETFDKVEKESGRIKKTEIMASYLKTVITTSPGDLADVLNLTTGQVAPTWEGKELGIGDAILKSVVQRVTGFKPSQLNEKIKEHGDIGIVAQMTKQNQSLLVKPQPLTVHGVVTKFLEILDAPNTDIKKQKITSMIVAAVGPEIKFLLRILKGVFRIGFSERSLPNALAIALCQIHKNKYDVERLTEIIKDAAARNPSFQILAKYVITEDPLDAFTTSCGVTLFTPFKPMLAKPKKSVEEVTGRFGFPFTCEYKYDGERGQIHYKEGLIKIFTRNLENYTEKYPDVIEAVKQSVLPEVKSFIIDCEIVAFNRETDEFQEFQILGRRAKKGVNIRSIAINVCVNAFDVLYLDGVDLMRKPLLERREQLHKVFKEVPQRFLFARYKNITSADDILPFFEEAVNHRTEGLMCKTTGDDSFYIPDKRSDTWYKLKKDYLSGLQDTVDLIPIGAWLGEGKRSGVYGAFLLACYNEDDDCYESVTKVGTGFSEDVLLEIYTRLKEKVSKNKPNTVMSGDNLPDVWFEPDEVWEIKGADLSLSLAYRAAIKKVNLEGRGVCLRFPRFIKKRDDKKCSDGTTNTQIFEMYKDQPSVRDTTDGKMKVLKDEDEKGEKENESGSESEEDN
ncbi:DNA ligase, putative [Entamoeba invadens IP1]|uniref:DNA ligase n=1 Tax=Entamoeba invadens IP1 TaxID=370355 RepID=A0A0A1UDR4_ENTIV|nr:DNA ligase, putative [Entamoeba invadens IP1]ELP90894.1 DNA ligase, putative [Entamoeba invadens IP1]|eukprot:XP_004257665.1 DNA ligase, putative [Entamoeba invadens IP1]